MTQLTWQDLGDRKFEVGLDRGVLFLEDGSGIPWNGLVSVSEKTSITVKPLYFDGQKFNDNVVLGDYAATLSAFTYPDEFLEYEGILDAGNGISIYDQPLKRFGLSYRTKLGNDVDGIDAGYKIHVIYNLIAIPSAQDFNTISDDTSATLFTWDISAVPVDVAGYAPTAHFVLDTTLSPAGLISSAEGWLYGSSSVDSQLKPMSFFINLANMDW